MRRAVGAATASALVVAGLLAGCGGPAPLPHRAALTPAPGSPSSVPAAPVARCVDPLDQSAPLQPQPTWVPATLPLPTGTFATTDYSQPGKPGHAAAFVVPGDVDGIVSYVTRAWPATGWRFTRSEHDAHDAELAFSDGPTEGSLHVVDGECGTVAQMVLAVGATG